MLKCSPCRRYLFRPLCHNLWRGLFSLMLQLQCNPFGGYMLLSQCGSTFYNPPNLKRVSRGRATVTYCQTILKAISISDIWVIWMIVYCTNLVSKNDLSFFLFWRLSSNCRANYFAGIHCDGSDIHYSDVFPMSSYRIFFCKYCWGNKRISLLKWCLYDLLIRRAIKAFYIFLFTVFMSRFQPPVRHITTLSSCPSSKKQT